MSSPTKKKQNFSLRALVKREYFSSSCEVLYTSTETRNFDTEWARMFAKISAVKEMGKKLNFGLNQHYVLLPTLK